MEHRRSSFGFEDFGVQIGLKNKRRKLKSKLVGLGEVGVIINGGVYLLINTFFFVLPSVRKSGFVYHTKHTAEVRKKKSISFMIDNMHYINFRI